MAQRNRHRKAYKTNPRQTTAAIVTATEVTLHTRFVAAVRAAYTSGNMHQRRLDDIIGAVDNALRGQTDLRVTWDDAAIDHALAYLEGRGQIKLPQGELAHVA
jgi:hypothetical protein